MCKWKPPLLKASHTPLTLREEEAYAVGRSNGDISTRGNVRNALFIDIEVPLI